ncbi:hypothetical protein NRIC_12230 [Enterococcus florum]|uniref:Uncharacterized protein n=1 Tax=Enterococcus florum TaxID=2480627 RepID=A0A4P5PCW5_9ENTE|nr:hypothetical protein [Enterococcus florum]GCF93332.1 hypothetical protein NRIC_12230 [Enterococcus florum]
MGKKQQPKTAKKSYSTIKIIAGILLIIFAVLFSDQLEHLSFPSFSASRESEISYIDGKDALWYIDEIPDWDEEIYEDIREATVHSETDKDGNYTESYSDGDDYEELVELVGPPKHTSAYEDETTGVRVTATWQADLDLGEDGEHVAVTIDYDRETGQILNKNCYASILQ